MKSCLGLLFTILVFIIVVGGGSLIWYLNHTAEFSQKSASDAADTSLPPTDR